eukprot:CAMPEP_0168221246 /NCGR_PEP_ID=MMETSP0140_2-20121125/9788_1 /TAXON_ID=44445 /ORGANISM="Pseudo-nitzschia australis, Strain 10249 10 AB" /LENGTH=190 /DNA_ID=CAMNT_0008150275 /DNA_START=171 /DNA_END=743 /DNA_ORIENTATION=-
MMQYQKQQQQQRQCNRRRQSSYSRKPSLFLPVIDEDKEMDCSDNNRYSSVGFCCLDCKFSYCCSGDGDDDYGSTTGYSYSCSNDDGNEDNHLSSSSFNHQGWCWNESRNFCCCGQRFYCNEEDHDDNNDDYQVFGWDSTDPSVEHVAVLAFLFVVLSMVAAARIGAACGASAISRIGTNGVNVSIGMGMD